METAVMTIENVLSEVEKLENTFTSSFLGLDGFVLIMEKLGLDDTLFDVISALKNQVWTETTAAIAELKDRLADRVDGHALGKELQRRAALQQQEDGGPI